MIRIDERPTLLMCALAAAADPLIGRIRSNGAQKQAEWAFLAQVHAGMGGGAWTDTLLACLADPAPEDKALVDLAEALELSPHEILAVTLAVGAEENPLVGTVLARLQKTEKNGSSRPTLGLISTLFDQVSPLELVHGAAVESGLLTLTDDARPLVERTLTVPLSLCMAIHGVDAPPAGTKIGLDEPLLLPESLTNEMARHAAALRGESVLVLHGSFAEGRAAAAEIARSMGRRPLFVDEGAPTMGLAPLIQLRGLLPVFGYRLGPGEHRPAPQIPCYEGPIVCVCGLDGQIEGSSGRAVVRCAIPIPPGDERRVLWAAALGEDEIADEMARHYRHSVERIAQLGKQAHYEARLNGRARPHLADLRRAMRSGGESGLDALAQPLPEEIGDAAMVAPPRLRDELELLWLRCQHRDRLTADLGISAQARYAPGVRALFTGPSGTGKTLAAGWLATRLGLPLYRVDLASVTSKYIGETEKNLAELLNRAERAGVILLFDEADSMFGKRTDIKDSHDRYANAQTNYLLQRIESFDGIALLTSNSRQRFDSAFARRLDAIVDFPLPGTDERRALWLAHLGDRHSLSAQAITRLAVSVDFAGGHIRNAVLTASVLAQAEDRPISLQDLKRGIAVEFAKVGRQMPTGIDE
ncbi:AAA family ATPase [bacterium]|nr:AAA family ATPase [bacterium]